MKTQDQIKTQLRPLNKSPIDAFHLAQARISRKDFAAMLGVPYMTLSGWMSGIVKWRDGALAQAKKYLEKQGVKV